MTLDDVGFACTCVARDRKLIQLVFAAPRPWILCGDERHDEGGQWSGMDHFVTVHLRHMAAQQPNVAQVLSLQEDFSAEWDATLTMWRVSCSKRFSDDEIQAPLLTGPQGSLNTDARFQLPDDLANLSVSDRDKCAFGGTDFVMFDQKRCFIRALILVPLLNQACEFCVNVWVEVTREVFDSYWGVFDSPSSKIPPASAKLANHIRPYALTRNIAVRLEFGDGSAPPQVRFAEDNHELELDIERGIDDYRHAVLLYGMGFRA